MDIVATRDIRAKMMALDFIVIMVEWEIPSLVATKGPILNKGLPWYVNGRKNQRKRIRPLTKRSRKQTFLRGSRARNIKETERKMAGISATKRSDVATTIENKKAITVLTLGSRRCIIESPLTNASSIMISSAVTVQLF
jgi:hypothetical protein